MVRRHRVGVLASAVVACSLAPLVVARADEAADTYNKANDLYDKKDFEGALAAYRLSASQVAASTNPKRADPQAMVGSALAQLGRFDECFKEYEKALELDKPGGHNSVYVHYQMGLIHGHKNEPEKAIECFKKGLALDPAHSDTWRNMGMAYAHLEKWPLVVDAFERSLAGNPDQPKLKSLLPDCRKKAGLDPGKPEASGAGVIKLDHPEVATEATFDLPSLGGWVTTSDEKTLIVSIPSTQELVFIDVSDKARERKRHKLDFAPGRLAIQGKSLLVAAQGKSSLSVLDAESARVTKTIATPDEIVELACHRTKGLAYASTTKQEILSIDARADKVAKTQAKGRFVAVDSKGSSVYVAEVGKDASVLRKLAPKGNDLTPIATNSSAEASGLSLHLAPSGKSVVVVGANMRPPLGGGVDGFLGAVLSTEDVVTCFGEIDFCARPDAVAIHPVLGLGVALRHDGGVLQFDSKTLERTKLEFLEERPIGADPRSVDFTARGQKLVCWQPPQGASSGRLTIAPLALSPEDRAAIAKAFPSAK